MSTEQWWTPEMVEALRARVTKVVGVEIDSVDSEEILTALTPHVEALEWDASVRGAKEALAIGVPHARAEAQLAEEGK